MIIKFLPLLLILLFIIFSYGFPRKKRALGHIYTTFWTNATIPYFINPSFSEADIFYLKRAMDMYSNETCVRFEPYKPDIHPNWLKIEESDICHSEIGMQNTGQQALFMARSCRNYGLMLHEIGHSIGLLHEMMRPDRNQFIRVYAENLQEDASQGFTIESQHYKLFGTSFDFQSITMYSPYDFSKNGLPVWTKMNASDRTPIFDNRERDISFWDIKAINEMYKCSNHCSNKSCTFPSFLNKNCTCQSPEDFADRRCVDDINYTNICQNASFSDVCYNKPVIASIICRKTCGRCFQYGRHGVTSPPKYNCVDHNVEQCKRNKYDGYCYTDTWTKVNCKMSCNKCEIHADPSVIEFSCKDRHNTDLCEEWANNGQCDQNPGFMKSNCAFSCGTCTSNSTAIKPQAPCRNYSPDSYCDAMARENKCEGTTLNICLGSCEKCGPNYERNEANISESEIDRVHKITIRKECKDILAECAYFSQAGYCQTHKESMKYHCNKSCNFCLESDCSNIDSDHVCDDVKQRGLCKLHAGFANRCKKTCEQCKPVLSTAVTSASCRDQEPKHICEELVRRNQCRVDVNRTRRCILSCNLCNSSFANMTIKPESVSTSTTSSIPCIDEERAEFCEYLSSNGWCQSYLDRAVLCRKSCNLCEASTPAKICKNEEDNITCKSWASVGYCTENREYMLNKCALSCNFCTISAQSNSLCKNTEEDSVCEAWVQEKYCETNSKYMKERCEKSCGFCTLPGVKKCADVESKGTCRTWKNRGYCTDYRDYLQKNCALTCNLCDLHIKSSTAPEIATTTVTLPCVNTQTDDTCESWKQGSYCSLDYIAEMCKKTCQRCA